MNVQDLGLPQQMPLAKFSRTSITDARDALALALTRLIEGVRFQAADTDRFAQIFDE